MSQHDPNQQQPQYDPRMYPPPGYEVRKRKSWPMRHKFLTFFTFPVAALILIIIIAVSTSGGSSTPSSAADSASGSSSSSSGNAAGSGNVACGADLKTMEKLIAEGDYSDAGSEANDDSTDATRQHAFLGVGIASDFSQLGMDADSADLDKATGGSSYAHDQSEVQADLVTLKKDCA